MKAWTLPSSGRGEQSQGELLKLAMKAAKSWVDQEQIAKVEVLQKARAEILVESNGEQWVINKAIHYNEWADLSKNDFKPVVTAFRKLLEQFRCDKLNVTLRCA